MPERTSKGPSQALRILDVYFHHRLVGRLSQARSGATYFEYLPSWLEDEDAIPLSQSLPLRSAPFKRDEWRPFFGGLLPEGRGAREALGRIFHVSANNDFSLLERIGGECAGAITLLPAGDEAPFSDAQYRPIPDGELAEKLKMLPKRPLLAGEAGVRLSLAGAQGKLPVYFDGSQIMVPLDNSPSTHILKPDSEGFPGLVSNEFICMSLAREVGLQTATVELKQTDGVNYLLIGRYDRARDSEGKVIRLHQEDFCQALGVTSDKKYQNEGGPGLADCFRLVRSSSTIPLVGIQALLDAVTFNFLIGNCDAHGKNFSLLYRGSTAANIQTTFAPLYDLVSTVFYEDLDVRMAMKIGSEYDPERVYFRHFDRLAEEAGLGSPFVRQRIRTIASKLLSTIPKIESPNQHAEQVKQFLWARFEKLSERFRQGAESN